MYKTFCGKKYLFDKWKHIPHMSPRESMSPGLRAPQKWKRVSRPDQLFPVLKKKTYFRKNPLLEVICSSPFQEKEGRWLTALRQCGAVWVSLCLGPCQGGRAKAAGLAGHHKVLTSCTASRSTWGPFFTDYHKVLLSFWLLILLNLQAFNRIKLWHCQQAFWWLLSRPGG